MNKILFFGASGRLGSEWIKKLSKCKNDFKVFANIHKTKLPNYDFVKIVKFNVKNRNSILNFCKQESIDIIINCIANTNVEKCEKFPKNANKINFLIAKNLCSISKDLKIRYVHISTDMLFDGKIRKKYTERSKTNPLNIYSKTKLKAEKFVKKYSKSLILRTNFFGETNLKKITFSENILRNREQKIYLWNDIFFNPVHIKLLISTVNLLIMKKVYGIYNISSNQCVSKFQLGKMIEKKFFKKSILVENSFSEKKHTKRPKNMCLSNDKLINKFKSLRNKLNLNTQLKLLKIEY